MSSKRNFTAVLLTGALLLTPACSSAGPEAEQSDSMVVASYGGAFQDVQREAFFTPFSASEGGVEVTDTTGSGFDKLKAMVDSAQVDWDVMTADSSAYMNSVGADILQPIDYSVVQADGVPDELKQEFGVGYMAFSINPGWSKEKFPEGLTPAQFFDPNIEARRVLLDQPSFNLEFALLGDGVAAEDMYPLDVDRALSVIDRVKDQIVGYRGSSDMQALVQQGEVDAAFIANGRVADAIAAGADWDYGFDGAVIDTEWWVVPKGAPNTEAAMEFINFSVQPEPQAALATEILYGPANTSAFEDLSSERAAELPSYPANAELGVALDAEWWAENQDTVLEKWQKWLLQ